MRCHSDKHIGILATGWVTECAACRHRLENDWIGVPAVNLERLLFQLIALVIGQRQNDRPYTPTLVQGSYWQVSGTIPNTGVTLDPIFTQTMNGSTDPCTGTYSIQAQGATGQSLYTRYFTPSIAANETTETDVVSDPKLFRVDSGDGGNGRNRYLGSQRESADKPAIDRLREGFANGEWQLLRCFGRFKRPPRQFAFLD